MMKKYDAIVVGAGPNGLACAITLRQAGWSVIVLERSSTPGGGTKTEELTLPGFHHDVCSAVHPMAVASPFFKTLPLQQYGLKWIHSPAALAHPFDNGDVAFLERHSDSIANNDKSAENFQFILNEILQPVLHVPRHPWRLARYGLQAIQSARAFAYRLKSEKDRALFLGMAAHSPASLEGRTSSAVALTLQMAGETVGWPIVEGGSSRISQALVDYFKSLGGEIEMSFEVTHLDQLAAISTDNTQLFFDLTPRQIFKFASHKLSRRMRKKFQNFPLGVGVFKIDWALNAPIPWKNLGCARAATIHLGGSSEEILESEFRIKRGEHSEKPFVILCQPTLFDPSRAPTGKHIAWAYCHVPNGSTADMTNSIENQIERFAPGFRETILARSRLFAKDFESRNPNMIGGDIFGGAPDKLIFRPQFSFHPYALDGKRLWICSSSTPPGPAVHGMCGYNAARAALALKNN